MIQESSGMTWTILSSFHPHKKGDQENISGKNHFTFEQSNKKMRQEGDEFVMPPETLKRLKNRPPMEKLNQIAKKPSRRPAGGPPAPPPPLGLKMVMRPSLSTPSRNWVELFALATRARKERERERWGRQQKPVLKTS